MKSVWHWPGSTYPFIPHTTNTLIWKEGKEREGERRVDRKLDIENWSRSSFSSIAILLVFLNGWEGMTEGGWGWWWCQGNKVTKDDDEYTWMSLQRWMDGRMDECGFFASIHGWIDECLKFTEHICRNSIRIKFLRAKWEKWENPPTPPPPPPLDGWWHITFLNTLLVLNNLAFKMAIYLDWMHFMNVYGSLKDMNSANTLPSVRKGKRQTLSLSKSTKLVW